MLKSLPQPRVSVVLPTYNRGYCLARAINSILNQTMRDLELIVVDDGSTDDTESVVDKYSDKRLRYFRLSENIGQSAAINFGVSRARANWIALQDSDDESLPERLDIQLKKVETDEHIDVVGARIMVVKENGAELGVKPEVDLECECSLKQSHFLKRNLTPQPTLFLRKTALESVGGFDTELQRFKDRDLMIRLTERFKVVALRDVVARVHVSLDSITAKRFPSSTHWLLEKNARALEKLACEELSNQFYANGVEYLRCRDSFNAALMFGKSHELDSGSSSLLLKIFAGLSPNWPAPMLALPLVGFRRFRLEKIKLARRLSRLSFV